MFTTLDVPGADYTEPLSINNSGQVTGSYIDSSGGHGFVYSNGTFTTFDPPGATDTKARSINDSGQVAGFFDDAEYEYRGFMYSNGTSTTINVPGAAGTRATSINNSGQVTGSYYEKRITGLEINVHGFIATPMVTDIPTLSQWALLLGGGLLVGMALLAQVRRTRPLRG